MLLQVPLSGVVSIEINNEQCAGGCAVLPASLLASLGLTITLNAQQESQSKYHLLVVKLQE